MGNDQSHPMDPVVVAMFESRSLGNVHGPEAPLAVFFPLLAPSCPN
jgi:hypothetical protein